MALVRLLRSLSQSMAVVATIHQPSAAAFYMFDRLLLLHRGAVCYQGPISHAEQQPARWFAAAGFAEEILPGLDFVPTATIAWFLTQSDAGQRIGEKVTPEAAPKKKAEDLRDGAIDV